MNLKVSKKLSELKLPKNQIIKGDDCAKVKGGRYYYCCARNKWYSY